MLMMSLRLVELLGLCRKLIMCVYRISTFLHVIGLEYSKAKVDSRGLNVAGA